MRRFDSVRVHTMGLCIIVGAFYGHVHNGGVLCIRDSNGFPRIHVLVLSLHPLPANALTQKISALALAELVQRAPLARRTTRPSA